MKKWFIWIGVLFVFVCNLQAKTLEQEFSDPPLKYRPSCFWGWVGGHITQAGIFSDLSAMKDAGMSGGLIFDLSLYIPEGDVPYGSEKWRDLVDYAVTTGSELGLEIGLQNCPGWATSGGPWISPERSMKRVVFSEITVDDSSRKPILLPPPPARENFYRDIAVLAVPAPALTPECNVSSILGGEESAAVPTSEVVQIQSEHTNIFTFSYSTPVEMSSLQFNLTGNVTGIVEGSIEVSHDGKSFHEIHSLRKPGRFRGQTAFTYTFPAVKSCTFRVNLVLPEFRGNVLKAKLGNMEFLQDARIPDYALLSLGSASATRQYIPPQKPSSDRSGTICPEEIRDLSRYLNPDGRLDWTPPPGRWTLLRFGYTTTGAKNHPARPGGEGLEVDKMNAAAVRDHFENSIGQIVERAGGAAASVFIDSWEAGQQNWTPGFAKEFSKRNDYDLLPFLPVLSGRMVRSPADSYSFLRDFRRTITDLVSENYYCVMREEAELCGATLIAEPYPGWSFDEFKAAGQVDVVAAEFWVGGGSLQTVKRVSSMAETIKSNKQVAAEAFTARPDQGRWLSTPRSLKPEADAAFVQGLNRILFHSFIHQPRDDMRPGFTHGRYGTEFGRHNTWWPLAKPFNDYLSRAGVLLRQGNRVADFLYLKNDGPFTDDLFPPVPEGYDYHYIAPFTLLGARVEAGAVIPPGGGRYSVVVFPKRWAADLPMLEKLIELKNGGIALMGPPPFMPAGRRDLQQLDAWERCCSQLWPTVTGYPTTRQLMEAAQKKGLGPDFKPQSNRSALEYVHRCTGDADLYFVRNSTDQPVFAPVTFRVSGKELELWNPVDGSIAAAAIASSADRESTVQIELPAFGSTFAVFRGAEDLPIESPSAESHPPLELASWTVEFKPAMGDAFTRSFAELSLWNESSDKAVKYFSGPATCTTEFELPKVSGSVELDLGEVYDVAEVSVNGASAGVCWTKPNTMDITGLVRPGLNRLEITVVNRWINRLIGDEFLPAEAAYKGMAHSSSATDGVLTEFPKWYMDPSIPRRRSTFVTWKHYNRESKLVPSGLAGPVRVRFLTDKNTTEKK